MPKSIGLPSDGKPAKPRPDFPLFVHQSAGGRWCKKVLGKFRYFGYVKDDPEGVAAEALWNKQKEALLAGRVYREPREGEPLLKHLANQFLTAKRLKVPKELAVRTYTEYHKMCERLLKHFGNDRIIADLAPEDFAKFRASLAKTRGPVALGNEIMRVRTLFNFGASDFKPKIPLPDYGTSFDKPKAREYELAKGDQPKMFQADEIRLMLTALEGKPVEVEGETVKRPANHVLRAIILLCINSGYGQTDVALLPKTSLDLKGGWATFRRNKTGAYRRSKLWSETVEALRLAISLRPDPKDPKDDGLVFLTSRGQPWVRDSIEEITEGDEVTALWNTRTDALGTVFGKLLRSLKIGGRRGLYGMRHSHQTAGEESLDMPAVKISMGHKDPSISATYRTVTDARLEAVAAAVHRWLFGVHP